MKSWHWGCIALLIVAYLVGVKWPSPGNKVFSAIGM